MPRIDESKYLVMAGWDDVPHLDADTKRKLLASTPVHLRAARSRGIPTLGSGAVFPVPEDMIRWKPTEIPSHWPRICGLDFGWDHPTAAVWIAWDRDTDTVYIYDCYRQSEAPVAVHADAIKARGDWIPVSWPADGLQTEKGSGFQLAAQYRDKGVACLQEHAQLPEQGVQDETQTTRTSVEAGIMLMLTAMQEGRFKVSEALNDWFEEFRMYHRKDGKIVKLMDDLISATRYGFVMLRYASLKPERNLINYTQDDWRT